MPVSVVAFRVNVPAKSLRMPPPSPLVAVLPMMTVELMVIVSQALNGPVQIPPPPGWFMPVGTTFAVLLAMTLLVMVIGPPSWSMPKLCPSSDGRLP